MKRTTKRRLSLIALNSTVVLIIVVLGLLTDWETVKAQFWKPEAVSFSGGTWGDLITTGAVNTIKYTAIAFAGGLSLGLLLALMRLSPIASLRWLATIYVEFFRGLPALVVIILMGFGVPLAFQWQPPGGLVGAGLIALVLVASAYMAETLRAGIQAVPKGQTEAARSLGMGSLSTTVRVVLPQAFRVVIPPLTNEFVLLIKDTALLSVIGAEPAQRELTTLARDLQSSGVSTGSSTTLVQAALIYLAITLPLTQLVAWLERRQRRASR
ncbi:amino acid ABC transporter permease [Nocardioides sp. MH1]|uniref:amino acid ABC transporter permease n=1 Tax=Nocardioides sp. MH1 TaxID=3242490 RepID=UPI0035224DCF